MCLRLILLALPLIALLTHLPALSNPLEEFKVNAYASSDKDGFCVTGICFPTTQASPPPTQAESVSTNAESRDQPPLKIDFLPWGEEDLSLESTTNDTGHMIFEIRGKTGEQAGGFLSQDLNYTGRKIAFGLGNVTKISSESAVPNPQTTVVFNITGNDEKSHYYRFTNGYLTLSGYHDTNYYQNLDANSSLLVDFDKVPLAEGGYKSLDNLIIVVQKGTSVDPFTFSILPEELIR